MQTAGHGRPAGEARGDTIRLAGRNHLWVAGPTRPGCRRAVRATVPGRRQGAAPMVLALRQAGEATAPGSRRASSTSPGRSPAGRDRSGRSPAGRDRSGRSPAGPGRWGIPGRPAVGPPGRCPPAGSPESRRHPGPARWLAPVADCPRVRAPRRCLATHGSCRALRPPGPGRPGPPRPAATTMRRADPVTDPRCPGLRASPSPLPWNRPFHPALAAAGLAASTPLMYLPVSSTILGAS